MCSKKSSIMLKPRIFNINKLSAIARNKSSIIDKNFNIVINIS